MKLKALMCLFLTCCMLTGCTENSVQDSSYQLEKIDIDKISLVTLTVMIAPPGETVELTQEQIEEMVELMEAVVINEKDDTYNQYGGQWVQFDITYDDGRETSIAVYTPFIIINYEGYRADHKPCQALAAFAESIVYG